jgi:hypothetical protein
MEMRMSDKPEVDVWTRGPTEYFIRAPQWKRAQGPFKCLADAVSPVLTEIGPFIINYRDPAEVPKEEWPITRSRSK